MLKSFQVQPFSFPDRKPQTQLLSDCAETKNNQAKLLKMSSNGTMEGLGLEDIVTKLDFKQIKIVELSNDNNTKCWWPCVEFPNFDCLLATLQQIPETILDPNVKYDIMASFMDPTSGMLEHTGSCWLILGNCDKGQPRQRIRVDLQASNTVSVVNSRHFFARLRTLGEQSKSQPYLESAVKELRSLWKYWRESSTASISTTASATASATANATAGTSNPVLAGKESLRPACDETPRNTNNYTEPESASGTLPKRRKLTESDTLSTTKQVEVVQQQSHGGDHEKKVAAATSTNDHPRTGQAKSPSATTPKAHMTTNKVTTSVSVSIEEKDREEAPKVSPMSTTSQKEKIATKDPPKVSNTMQPPNKNDQHKPVASGSLSKLDGQKKDTTKADKKLPSPSHQPVKPRLPAAAVVHKAQHFSEKVKEMEQRKVQGDRNLIKQPAKRADNTGERVLQNGIKKEETSSPQRGLVESLPEQPRVEKQKTYQSSVNDAKIVHSAVGHQTKQKSQKAPISKSQLQSVGQHNDMSMAEKTQETEKSYEQTEPMEEENDYTSTAVPAASSDDMDHTSSGQGQHPEPEMQRVQPRMRISPPPLIRPSELANDVVLPGETVGQKLNNCEKALRRQGNEEMIIRGRLASSLQTITNFVHTVVETEGRYGSIDENSSLPSSPPIMYVCGAPGTGKTMGVKMCCNSVRGMKMTKLEKWDSPPQFSYLNGSQVRGLSKRDALDKTLEALCLSSQADLNRTTSRKRASVFTLILDEIDLLLSSTSSSSSSSTHSSSSSSSKGGPEEFLRTIFAWAADPDMKFALIGIANSVGNANSRRLNALGMTHGNKLVFGTYDKNDLMSIIKSKIGTSVVDSKVIEFIASKVAATSGDVRAALDLVSKCLAKYKEKTSIETFQSGMPMNKPLVKLPHAMMVIRETNIKYKDLIEDLPSYEKCTLCVGVNLSRRLAAAAAASSSDGNSKSAEKRVLTLGMLKAYSMEAFGFDGSLESDIGLEEFKGIIERLQDNGLLKLADCDSRSLSTEPIHSLLRYPVCFDMQLEDVESALEDILKGEFYQRLKRRLDGMDISK